MGGQGAPEVRLPNNTPEPIVAKRAEGSARAFGRATLSEGTRYFSRVCSCEPCDLACVLGYSTPWGSPGGFSKGRKPQGGNPTVDSCLRRNDRRRVIHGRVT